MTENTETMIEEQKQAIQKMLHIQMNTNWTPLPEEAERQVEKAYEHLEWAMLEVEDSDD